MGSGKKLKWWAFAAVLMLFAALQFVPSPALVVPAQLPAEQREAHRLLNFEGISNFRDLGGYSAADGRALRWGSLYRAGTLAHASDTDLRNLDQLGLSVMVDFRSSPEKQEEPNRLPDPRKFRVVEIPTLDDGNKALVGEIMSRIESGNFDGFDPNASMIQANRQFADEFTPQFREFIQTVVLADGAPVLWHCSAGKDRTGFAAAILLRILGVQQELVMQDYMASRQHALDGRKNQLRLLRLFKGDEAADKLTVMLGVEKPWLQAAFDEIDKRWGTFDNYVKQGLELDDNTVDQLRATLLE